MFSFGWFSSGRDQAAIDLFTAVMDRLATGFIAGRLAEHAAAYKLGGHGRESYPTKKIMDMIIARLRRLAAMDKYHHAKKSS